jgi:hypothetical protein
MTTRHDKPADTTMMGVVHDALRRDLARLQTALPGSPPPCLVRGRRATVPEPGKSGGAGMAHCPLQ